MYVGFGMPQQCVAMCVLSHGSCILNYQAPLPPRPLSTLNVFQRVRNGLIDD